MRTSRPIEAEQLARITKDDCALLRHLGGLVVILFWASLASGAAAQAEQPLRCASTLAELRALAGDFPLRWTETAMRDGKPLIVTVGERQGGLFLEFVKSREGMWAEGLGVICRNGTALEALFKSDHISLGPAAHWVLRMALAQGGRFTLTRFDPAQLDIATTGWRSTFSATAPK